MFSKEIKTLDGVRVLKLNDKDAEEFNTLYRGYELLIHYLKDIPIIFIRFYPDRQEYALHHVIGRRNLHHDFVIGDGEAFYHVNGDTFDNRSENIGLKKVKMKGATWDKRARKWRSQIWLQGKVKHLGHFRTPEEAHLAYLVALHENLDQRIYEPGV